MTLPTYVDLCHFARPFSDDTTLDGTILKPTRCLSVNIETGEVSETDGYSSISHTDAIRNGDCIHVYMPCTDRIRPDVLHAMIRHAAED